MCQIENVNGALFNPGYSLPVPGLNVAQKFSQMVTRDDLFSELFMLVILLKVSKLHPPPVPSLQVELKGGAGGAGRGGEKEEPRKECEVEGLCCISGNRDSGRWWRRVLIRVEEKEEEREQGDEEKEEMEEDKKERWRTGRRRRQDTSSGKKRRMRRTVGERKKQGGKGDGSGWVRSEEEVLQGEQRRSER